MADTKFTPGPWEIVPANGGRALSIKKGLASIASISVTNINRKANARLISAAPEMYEALRSLLALSRPDFSDSPKMLALNLAEAAIARAEGTE